ncbi:LuxS/MPP-like metallohydrolase [Rickenella mellea]|uniref:Cytochrome b-c1 complex subunit 2, mitochondrial n=1 Tax=Rickenella mellea TaxID=50990 RepID=A0A4Y7QI96_9AGAM|nr:LuxS/MPP-like metallohydrolase [Rickenella mellea]
MLAARATTRTVLRVRKFATAVDAAGVKVAAIDHGQPTSSVTVLLKAGSRYDTKHGVAHVLKNFAFKSTNKRSALGTVREAELYGGVLSSSLTREHVALTAEFLRGDEQFFVDVLASYITSSKFTPWELNETVLPVVEAETHAAQSDNAARAIELAHAAAFRKGLGFSVLAPTHSGITSDDVQAFAASAFSRGNIAVVGTGIDQGLLTKLVEQNFSSATASSAPTTSPSKYFGGDTRVASQDGVQTVFIGFGTSGAPSPELAVLAAHLSPKPALKWSKGTSPLATALPPQTSVQTVLLPYSDATLFGLLVQGATVEGVREASKAAAKALKDAAATGGVKADDLKKAIAKAKFTAANAVEDRDGFISTVGSQLLSGSPSSLDSVFTALDKIESAAFAKATSSLVKSTPTFVAVGDIYGLPHRDEIGI